MRVFVTAKFQGEKNKQEIEHLCNLIRSAGLEDFCFIRDVENYQKTFDNPKELMRRAREEIEKSDALLIDFSDESPGRIIEAGIAYTLGKKVIIIIKRGTEIRDSAKGIADLVIEYENLEEITPKLKKWLFSQAEVV